MNAFFKPIEQDKIIALSFLVSLTFLVFAFVAALLAYRNLPPLVPIFNQLPWGSERLGDKIQIFIPIAIAFGIFLSNYTIAGILYKQTPLTARIVAITSSIASFFIFIFIINALQRILI